MEFIQDKFRFSRGRQPVDVVAFELAEATGIPVERILKEIPDLTKDHLSAGIVWTSERFAEDHVGIHNSLLSQGWIEVRFPVLNVDGSVQNDLTEVKKSYAVSAITGEIHSFPDFTGSEEWLATSLGYISIND